MIKDGKSRFFEESFLMADMSMDVIFEIFFVIISNVKVKFNNQELR